MDTESKRNTDVVKDVGTEVAFVFHSSSVDLVLEFVSCRLVFDPERSPLLLGHF